MLHKNVIKYAVSKIKGCALFQLTEKNLRPLQLSAYSNDLSLFIVPLIVGLMWGAKSYLLK